MEAGDYLYPTEVPFRFEELPAPSWDDLTDALWNLCTSNAGSGWMHGSGDELSETYQQAVRQLEVAFETSTAKGMEALTMVGALVAEKAIPIPADLAAFRQNFLVAACALRDLLMLQAAMAGTRLVLTDEEIEGHLATHGEPLGITLTIYTVGADDE